MAPPKGDNPTTGNTVSTLPVGVIWRDRHCPLLSRTIIFISQGNKRNSAVPLFFLGNMLFELPHFFIKTCENDILIDRYHAPGGFLKSLHPRQ
jgi:hypothetical protein